MSNSNQSIYVFRYPLYEILFWLLASVILFLLAFFNPYKLYKPMYVTVIFCIAACASLLPVYFSLEYVEVSDNWIAVKKIFRKAIRLRFSEVVYIEAVTHRGAVLLSDGMQQIKIGKNLNDFDLLIKYIESKIDPKICIPKANFYTISRFELITLPVFGVVCTGLLFLMYNQRNFFMAEGLFLIYLVYAYTWHRRVTKVTLSESGVIFKGLLFNQFILRDEIATVKKYQSANLDCMIEVLTTQNKKYIIRGMLPNDESVYASIVTMLTKQSEEETNE